MKIQPGNKGLTVKVNLWSLTKCLDTWNARQARLCIWGKISRADGVTRHFHDAGELITILGEWNSQQFKALKNAKKKAAK